MDSSAKLFKVGDIVCYTVGFFLHDKYYSLVIGEKNEFGNYLIYDYGYPSSTRRCNLKRYTTYESPNR